MAREEWDRDRGYGGEYGRHGAWRARWGRHGREDRDREDRWMSDVPPAWRGRAEYGAGYMPRHAGRHLERGRWGEPGSWQGGWTEDRDRWGAPVRHRREGLGRGWQRGWGERMGGPGRGWAVSGAGRPGRGWRVVGRRAHTGYGAAYYGAAYGSPEYAPGRGRRRQHGGWGGFGGERMSGRGAYYGGEYGW